jgi:ABC-type phosphate transport system substrate-binding protein
MSRLTPSRAIALSFVFAVAGCTSPLPSPPPDSLATSSIDGSSTAYPISDEVAKEYSLLLKEKAAF